MHALQSNYCLGKVPEAVVFTHTGWRKIDGVWVYLHGAGGIGADGEVKNVNVSLQEKLSPLQNCRHPRPI